MSLESGTSTVPMASAKRPGAMRWARLPGPRRAQAIACASATIPMPSMSMQSGPITAKWRSETRPSSWARGADTPRPRKASTAETWDDAPAPVHLQ